MLSFRRLHEDPEEEVGGSGERSLMEGVWV